MAKEVATKTKAESSLPSLTYTKDQVDLIKRLYCKNSTDDEFALFRYVCEQTGLNPMLRQIHAVKRWDSETKSDKMAIQVGIDGYRVQAERTREYCPGREPVFTYGKDGVMLISATAYVLKKVDGQWKEIGATAFYSEYVQTTKEGKPNRMWSKMPHGQLAKCAEALALRKAFSEQLSAIRTDEEMGQADNEAIEAEVIHPRRAAPAPESNTEAKPEPQPEKGTEGDGQDPIYTIEKVTKSAFGNSTSFFAYAGGKKWLTEDEAIGKQLKAWWESKTPVMILGDDPGPNNSTIIREVSPVVEQVKEEVAA